MSNEFSMESVRVNSGCASCARCDLRKTAKQVVQGHGCTDNPVFVVVDAPTYADNINGAFFAKGTAAGDALDSALATADLKRDRIWFDSVVKCWPKKETHNKRPAKKSEIDLCCSYLEENIAALKPRYIVVMGNEAIKYMLGDRCATVGSKHGQFVWSDKYQAYLMGTYNPASLSTSKLFHRSYCASISADFRKLSQALSSGTSLERKPVTYTLATTHQELYSVLDELSVQTAFSFDTETTGLDPAADNVLCVGFSWKSTTGVCIPLIKEDGVTPFWDAKTDEMIRQRLCTVFSNEALKIGHNTQFDVKMLWRALGCRFNNVMFDTLLAYHLIDEESQGMRGLKDLAMVYTDMGAYDAEKVQFQKDNKLKESVVGIPFSLLGSYCAADCDATFRLYEIFKKMLESEGVLNLFNKLTMPANMLLAEASYRGILLDVAYKDQLRAQYADTVQQLTADIYALAGKEFNIDSGKQLAQVLFTNLGLPVLAYTASGAPSTDVAALKALSKKHKIVPKLLEYRKCTKLVGTYLDGMPYDEHGRVHTTYNVAGTTTGRLSSNGPNCQNLPRDKEIKRLFISKPGYTLVHVDYSQGEFRCIRGDQRVLMSDFSYKQIKDVRVGDSVCAIDENSHQPGCSPRRFRFAEVTAVMKQGIKPCVRVYSKAIRGASRSIICTADHRFLRYDGINSNARRLWAPVRTGSRCAAMPVVGIENMADYIRGSIWGLYLTDGSSRLANVNNLSAKITQKDRSVLDYVLTHMRSMGIQASLRGGDITWYGENVPKFIDIYGIGSSDSYKRGVISGCILGDGWFGCGSKINPQVTLDLGLSCIHPYILEIVSKHLEDLRTRFSFDYTVHAAPLREDKENKPFYHYSFSGNAVFVFPLLIPGEKTKKFNERILHRKGLMTMDSPRVRVEAVPGTYETYDITTTSGTFVCEGFFVHNCWMSYANDKRGLDDIANGFDVHRWAAAKTHGIPEDQVTKEQRTAAKRVVFGCVPGRSRVLTDKGAVAIETLVGKRSTLFNGSNFVEAECVQTKIDSLLVFNGMLEVSSDHVLPVLSEEGFFWRSASSVKVGDYLMRAHPHSAKFSGMPLSLRFDIEAILFAVRHVSETLGYSGDATFAFLSGEMLSKRLDVDPLTNFLSCDNVEFVRVCEIAPTQVCEQLYDIVTFDDPHTFLCNGYVVHNCMYGMGVDLAAELTGLSISKARKVLDVFFGRYPTAKVWLDAIVSQAKRDKYLVNIFGRKRRFPLFAGNASARATQDQVALAERQAKNFLMQSTTSDITLFAGVRLRPLLRPYDAHLVLTVHDSLVYEVPDEHVETVQKIIQDECVRPIKGYLAKIDVELKSGKYWE